MRDSPSTKVDARSLRAITITLLGLSASLSPATPAYAEDAVSVGNGLFAFTSIDAMQGWRFSVDVPIHVTALGILDSDNDGLASSHQVGIWNEEGTLLVTTTVHAGTIHPLVNRFRYASIEEGPPPDALMPGQTYTIGYFLGAFSDDMFILHNVHTMNPVINQVGASVFTPSSTFAMPTTPSPSQCFGPGFQFVVVPAPSVMMLFAAATMLVRRRRARGLASSI